MNIYVDGMFFRLSGIGRLFENLMKALIGSRDIDCILTIVPQELIYEFRDTFPQQKIIVKPGKLPLSGWDFFTKSRIIKSFDPIPDIYFFPNFNIPFFLNGRIISIVHDLIPLTSYFDWPVYKKYLFYQLIRRLLRVSVFTICVSHFTRNELVRKFGCNKKKLHVIYPWIEDEFFHDIHIIQKRPRCVDSDYILFVGNRFIHKNLKILMQAFRILINDYPYIKIIIAGARMRSVDHIDKAIMNDKSLQNKVVQIFNATDDIIKNLYANASVFVFPSLLEGFGIPPLEALAYGIPVVCSDIPVIREVCGESVRYADPNDATSFAEEIGKALNSPKQSSTEIDSGIHQVEMYRREIALERYLNLFNNVLVNSSLK